MRTGKLQAMYGPPAGGGDCSTEVNDSRIRSPRSDAVDLSSPSKKFPDSNAHACHVIYCKAAPDHVLVVRILHAMMDVEVGIGAGRPR